MAVKIDTTLNINWAFILINYHPILFSPEKREIKALIWQPKRETGYRARINSQE
ncbi:MAG: hypothetical protein ACFFD4_17945 [Candidatus Odinarchaeota archaeon]